MSDFKARKGDHLVAHGRIAENQIAATVHHTDGSAESVVIEQGTSSSDNMRAEKCGDGRARGVYHLNGVTHDGPAFVNSPQFCENYERIFGQKAPKHQRN